VAGFFPQTPLKNWLLQQLVHPPGTVLPNRGVLANWLLLSPFTRKPGSKIDLASSTITRVSLVICYRYNFRFKFSRSTQARIFCFQFCSISFLTIWISILGGTTAITLDMFVHGGIYHVPKLVDSGRGLVAMFYLSVYIHRAYSDTRIIRTSSDFVVLARPWERGQGRLVSRDTPDI
jgi:hypothetical protein